MTQDSSPYAFTVREDWDKKTDQLIQEHPLKKKEIVDVVLSSWNSIFDSRLGARGFQIGVDIAPKPQIMGFLLHELIPLELQSRYPGIWRGEQVAGDKDIVHIPDQKYSIEIKTSSDKTHIYGNRSYAQTGSTKKKSKTGYYLAVNFGKFSADSNRPKIALVRFGWLDHSDWMGQESPTGQQARLNAKVEQTKLQTLYRI